MGKDYPVKLWQEYHSGGRSTLSRLELEMFLADYFDERLRVASRDVARSRYRNYARQDLGSGCANCDFVTGADVVRRLCHPSVEQNKARVTELLSYGPARAEATKFEKEI